MHEHVADTESRCTECRARGLLLHMKTSAENQIPAHTQEPRPRGLDVARSPRPAIQSQGRMRKPRRADQDENLRNDVAGMIADMCLPAEVLGPRLMDGAHQIVVVVRERVLREIESYARENIR